MKVNVIIPTFNRRDSLADLLESLAQQIYPSDSFEVIVVDDGSTDGTEKIVARTFPFTLRYFRQANQGDAAARNLGAQQSRAEILVFLDDDMLVEHNYLACLLDEHGSPGKKNVIGTEYLWLDDSNPLENGLHQNQFQICEHGHPSVEHPFVEVFSRNMSLRRDDYFTVGLMDGFGFPGSNIWCDVDFNYRAHLHGFEFRRSLGAICYHRDYISQDLRRAKQRGWEMAYRAVVMFQKHPELISYLPMFRDKTRVQWQGDSPGLILRKLVRPAASSRVVLSTMELLVRILEICFPNPMLIRPLHRWIIGGHHYRGYREGLRDFAPGALKKSNEIVERFS